MKKYQVFREKATGKIAGIFKNCRTQSTIFKDKKKYDEFESDIYMLVEIMPSPTIPLGLEELEFKSPDGTVWKLKVNDVGKLRVEK